jgi:hypothetical protein
MKSHQKSLAQSWILGVLVVVLFNGTGCSSKKKVQDDGSENEVSLKTDRSQFKELRKDIPLEDQIRNDELATILQSMNKPEEDPYRVRDRFNTLVSRKREKFNKFIQKERDTFNAQQKTQRDQFLATISEERKKWTGKKHTSAETQEFYAKLEARRSQYTSEERDRRSEFDAAVRDRRSSFDENVRGITQKFNDEHRRYSQNYMEYRKAQELKKTSQKPGKAFLDQNGEPIDYSQTTQQVNGVPQPQSQVKPAAQTAPAGNTVDNSVNDKDLEDFKKIPPGQGQPLGSDQNGN